ncbi:MAG: phage terminase large subunit family protein [Pseudolabrys sp.]
MAIKLKRTALMVMAATLAAVMRPPVPVAPSVWAERSINLADGPNKGERFDLSRTPYLREVLDFFADACPDNKASIRKSKQSGFSTAAIILSGYTAAQEPCDLFLIEPTDSSLRDFIDEKLQPTVDGSPAFAAALRPQVSRSGKGSTTYTKRFKGGSLLLATASSTAELRGKTRRKVIEDEASEYAADLEGQGSPHDMITGAYETFLKAGTWKHLKISTPVVKGECDIDAEFEAGDQRHWHHVCPNCRAPFHFKFDRKYFIFNEAYPYNAHYVTECCGCPIEEHQRGALMRSAEADGGGWIATKPEPGRARSYHFDALSSPFVPWNTIAERFITSKGNPAKEKTFYNLTLGLAYEMRGDAPDWKRLLDRRETYRDGHVPARGLLYTIGADVQHTGIWVEGVAFAPNGESWSVFHEFLEGDTTDSTRGAFLKLSAIYDRKLPDAFGGMREHDAMFVDAGDGGRSNQVYAFCRGRAKAFAIKGASGWTAPSIGTPSQVDVTVDGRKYKGGATLWPVGTWSLKAIWYSNLRKDGIRTGAEIDPPGYVHLHEGNDERYCKQVTAEYLATQTVRGRSTRVWKEAGPNHLLDCRIYAMAAAEMMGLTRMTEAQWAELARHRGMPAEAIASDLFAAEPIKLAAAGELNAVQPVAESSERQEPVERPVTGGDGGWWERG